ncbi:MAG: DUF4332 domain-containing protein [Thermoproteota archaeon]|nr:DUF4332 domain-containing protein [Thermoproteota archaeon]
MRARSKRGIIVWILSSIAFLTAVNAFNAVRLWETKSLEDALRISLPIPGLEHVCTHVNVLTYLWISIITTIVFIGLTAVVAYRELPPNPALLTKVDDIEEEITANTNIIRSTNASLLRELNENKKDREKFFKDVAAHLKKTRKETLGTLESHRKIMQKVNANLEDTRRDVQETLGKQGEELEEVRRLSRKTAATVKKQSKDLAKITDRVEKIEKELMPQPLLTSQDKLEKIKGIGPQLGKELRTMRIANVGELVLGDARTIAEKTRVSREMAEHLQTTAQLLMIPGVSGTDVELLEEAGITTKKNLASQDPIQLGRKIDDIVKVYVKKGKISESEKPTLEEISFWIKQAKT